MLQAEILVQYGMRNKAVERLQRIQELFPREEERNEDLQRLVSFCGGDAALCGIGAAASGSGSASGAVRWRGSACADPAAEMRNVTRVAEITRKLYHQATAAAVLTTAVNEIGGHWEVSRCVAAMRTPGSAPSAVQEFCGEGVKAGGSGAIKEVMCALQDLALSSSRASP